MTLTEFVAIFREISLSGSTLAIERIPVQVRCDACGHEHEPVEPAFLVCPACRAARPTVLRGSGVLLRSLEVDEPDGDPATER